MRRILVFTLLTVAGCSEIVASGNQNGGTLQRAFNSDQQLLAAADAHCRNYGKTARFSGPMVDTLRVKFDCV